ncbi:MAG: RHS repeat protein [Spirochaetales bacterium]|nr:RHS repeat protein [Spirochaetales bacterium]
MRIISVLLFILSLLCHCTDNNSYNNENTRNEGLKSVQQTDVESFGLKGRVKEWIRQSFGVSREQGEGNKILLKKELYRFNESGMYTGIQDFDNNNNLISKGVYHYNPDGKRAEEIYYDGEGQVLTKVTCEYDENGHKIKEVKEDITGGIVYTSEWLYDNSGNMIRVVTFMKGNLFDYMMSKVEKSYDKNGILSEESWLEYKIDGNIQFKKIITYGNDGNIIQKLEYDDNNVLVDKITYEYESHKKITKILESCYNYETKQFEELMTTYTYDESGNILEHRDLEGMTTYRYDASGNELSMTEFSRWNFPIKKRYRTYDKNNKKQKEETIFYSEKGNITKKYIYVYDENENPVRWGRYDQNNNLLYEYLTLYDRKGNKQEEIVDSTERLPKMKYNYTYDTIGNHRETKCFVLHDNSESELFQVYEYSFTYWE